MRATRVVLVSVFILFICGLTPRLFSQSLEVVGANNPPYTPEKLVENILLGNGVNVLNINFEGDSKAVGYFASGDNEINLERGMVLSTGNAEDATKPNRYPTTDPDAFAQTSGSSVSDADLLALTNGGGLQDIVKYEITFEPFGDKLQFRYVFASEEYPTFSCYNYNDVFGFFITGPKPGGGTYNAENIAIVPGSGNLEVAINSVHDGNPFIPDPSLCAPINPQFYNDNTGSNTMAYNAFLDIFTAAVDVIPCETYTIKLALGDGSLTGTDDNFDSAVFLEAKSFETSSLQVEAVSVSLDGSVIEGCSQANLNFTLPEPVSSDYPINFVLSGTATNGVDYQTIPANLIIPAGDTEITLPIIAAQDNMIEGSESLEIEVIISACKRDTFIYYIKDNILTDPDLGNDTTICTGQSVQLDGDLNISSIPPQTFTNSSPMSIPDRNPNPFSSDVFSLTSNLAASAVDPGTIVEGMIQEVCIDITHAEAEDLDISLVSPSGQIIELSSDNGGSSSAYGNTCFSPASTDNIISATAPFTSTYTPEGKWEDLWDGNFPSNGTWQLVVVDDETGITGMLNEWSITFNSLYEVNYSWSPAAGLSCTDCPNPVASPTTTTTYTLTVSDTYGCQMQDAIEVNVQDQLAAPTITCGTSTTSTVSFSWDEITGATGYEVNIDGGGWLSPNNGARSHNVTGLTLNETVNIQVRATGDCGADIGTGSCTSSNCTPPSGLLNITNAISCIGETDAEISVTGMNGTAPYTYTLGANTNNTGIFVGLDDGKHYISINDALGCSTLDSIEISEPTALSLMGSSKAEGCAGSANGEATVTVTGGTGPYTYAWGPTTQNQTTATATGLTGGSYGVMVTDSKGCNSSTSVSVGAGGSFTIQLSEQNPSCPGIGDGQANVNVMGGQAPFTYLWNDINATTTALLDNIGVGTFTVTVTDNSGCKVSDFTTLTAPSSLTVGSSNSLASCYNTADGGISFTVSGGTLPYTYKWSDNGTPAASRNDLLPAEYIITITDATGCGSVETVEVFSPSEVMVSFNPETLSCFGSGDGEVSVSATGGAGGFMYQWNDPNNQTNSIAQNLDAGMIAITVEDASGCIKIDSVEIIQPDEIEITPTAVPTKCNDGNDGSISLDVIGGAGNYTYLWDDANNQITSTAQNLSPTSYTVTVSDMNGCTATNSATVTEPNSITSSTSIVALNCAGSNTNSVEVSAFGGSNNFNYVWSDPNNQRNSTATGLAPGKYFVTVTDDKGCSQLDSIDVIPPAAIILDLSSTNVSCFQGSDGTATGVASGGVGQLSFKWSNDSNSEIISGLSANQYCVTVTDENGCFTSDCIQVNQPFEIETLEDLTPVDCRGNSTGEIELSPIGGQGNYTYSWMGPNGFNSTDSLITSLPSGDYALTITDGSGCNLTKVIKLPEPDELIVRMNVDDVKCFGETSGHVLATAIGGNAPYLYQWETGQDSARLAGVAAGDYQLTVTDNTGCTFEKMATVNEPETPLEVDFDVDQISCAGQNDGAIVFNIEGGTPSYQYSVNGVDYSPYPTAFGLEPGVYDLYAVDANGCTVDSTGVEIIEPDAIIVDLGENIKLALGEEVMLEADISNAIGTDMEYEWKSNISNSLSCEDCPNPMINTLYTAAINLRVIDENGCYGEDNLQVIVEKDREIFVPSAFTPNGDGNNDNLQVHGKTGTKVLSFKIYDRWGELLYEIGDFEINSIEQVWNGEFRNRPMSTGIYIWKAEVEFIDGYTQIFTGETTLIR